MKKGMDWSIFGLKKTVCLVAGLVAFGLADNPISTYHYLADPAAAADSEERVQHAPASGAEQMAHTRLDKAGAKECF